MMLRIYTCSKRVKEGNLEHQILENENVIKIAEIVEKLEVQSGACESDFDELELDDNCKDWVMSLLKSESVNQNEIGFLLNDFTGRMQTSVVSQRKIYNDLATIDCKEIIEP
jgi:hypothetical protein